MTNEHPYFKATCHDCWRRTDCYVCFDCRGVPNRGIVCDDCAKEHDATYHPAPILDVTAPRDYGYFTSRIDGPGIDSAVKGGE